MMNRNESRVATIGVAIVNDVVAATVVICNVDGSNVLTRPVKHMGQTAADCCTAISTEQKNLATTNSKVDIVVADSNAPGAYIYELLKQTALNVHLKSLRTTTDCDYHRFNSEESRMAHELSTIGGFSCGLEINNDGQWWLPTPNAYTRSVVVAYNHIIDRFTPKTEGLINDDLPETIEHTDDKTYVAYGFASSGLHASLVKVTSAKDGRDFEYESTEMGMENVSDIVNRIPVIAKNIPVAVDMGGYGWQVEQELALKGIISFPIRLNAIHSPKTTLEESLLEQLAISNSPITKSLNFKKGSRTGSDNADYKAILAAYSLIANPPQSKAEKDEYIEIKGDGYYIKFKTSDLNCGKGIDYNVETGQLIISKLPDSVVAQLKELFGDINPLESAKRSDDEIMSQNIEVYQGTLQDDEERKRRDEEERKGRSHRGASNW